MVFAMCLACCLRGSTSPLPHPSSQGLSSLQRVSAPEYVEDNLGDMLHHHNPYFQRCYAAKIETTIVTADLNSTLDPGLWSFTGETDAMEGRLLIWQAKPNSIYDGWRVIVSPGWRTPFIAICSDLICMGTKGKGWTSLRVCAPAHEADIPRVRELFRYTFGVP
jgi:hypothetical protein